MATRVFHPDEAVLVPADKIIGVKRTTDGWFIPQAVIDNLTHIEYASLFYALGQRIGIDDFSVDRADDQNGWTLTPNNGRAVRRFTVRSPPHSPA